MAPNPSPGGSPGRSAAFFDLDRTLIAGSSGLPWARAATKAGLISRGQMVRWGVDATRFRLRGATDEATEKLMGEVKEVFRGMSARDLARLAPEVLVGVLPRIYPEMLAEVYSHQDAGRADDEGRAAGDGVVGHLAHVLGPPSRKADPAHHARPVGGTREVHAAGTRHQVAVEVEESCDPAHGPPGA